MKKLGLVIVVLVLVINSYYNYRHQRFNKEAEEFFNYLELKTQCDMFRESATENDVWLAHQGRTRSDLKGRDAEILPFREMYDTQIPECKEFVQYMCWYGSLPGEKYYEKCKDK